MGCNEIPVKVKNSMRTTGAVTRDYISQGRMDQQEGNKSLEAKAASCRKILLLFLQAAFMFTATKYKINGK